VWAFAKCNISDKRDEAINEIKMAWRLPGITPSGSRWRARTCLRSVRSRLWRSKANMYHTSEHKQLGETRNAALSDELGLTDFLADRFAVAGTPDECLEKVRTIQDAGVDNLLILAISTDSDSIIRRIGQEVISRL